MKNMKYLSFIKTQDYLGESINFSINNQSSFKTVAGGYLSISIYILYIYLFYLFGFDFLFHKNPNVYSQMKTMNNGSIPIMKVTKDDFIFAIRFEDNTGKVFNFEDYFYMDLVYKRNHYNKTSQKFESEGINIDLVNCDKYPKKFEKIPNSVFNISTFNCPDFNKFNNDLQLGGYWEDNEVSFLRFKLKLCKDKEMKICKSGDNLVDLIEKSDNLMIKVIYPAIIFKADDYLTPFNNTIKSFSNLIGPQITFSDELHLGLINLNQDAGVIFESSKDILEIGGLKVINKISTVLDEDDEIKKSRNKISKNYYYSMMVFFDKNYLYHTRKYMKFQDLLANVSGFMELIIMIFGFVYKFYNKFRLDSFLFKRLIYIKGEINCDSKILQHKEKEMKDIINFENKNNNINVNNDKNRDAKIDSDGQLDKNTNINHNALKDKDNKFTSYTENTVVKLNRNYSLEIDKINTVNKKPKESDISTFRNLIKNEKCEDFSIIDKSANLSNFGKDNNDKSNLNLIENNIIIINRENEEFDNMKFKKKLEKFKAKKNILIMDAFYYFKYWIKCSSKKDKNRTLTIYDILDKYSEKIYKKFDIFHYLKCLKNLKHLKKYLLGIEQRYIIDILSRKNYSLKISDFSKNKEKKKTKKLTEEEKFSLYTDKVINSAKINNDQKFLKLVFRANEDF